MNSKVVKLKLICLLLAGVSQAGTNYFVKATGFWDDDSKWNADTGSGITNLAPVSDPLGKINSKSGNTITLTNPATVGFLALNSGDSTLDVVIDGGALRSDMDGNGVWNAVGYNKTSTMLVENGGSWICDGRLDVGLFDNVNGQVNTFTMADDSGDVTVLNDFSIGRAFDGSHSASAQAYILGGTLSVGGEFSISPHGTNLMDISGTAEVVIDGDASSKVHGYIADGKITGNGGAEFVIYDYNVSHPDKTTLTATSSVVTPNWQLASTLYSTNELIVTPFDALADFGIVADGETDVTAAIQNALTIIGNLGGGALFLPAGHYKVGGNLTVPSSVTLRGDWKPPVPGQPVAGTVLRAYAGKGNANGTPFITMSNNSGVNGISIWYPEQLPANIQPYPPTFAKGGGATVENIMFVNAYFGFTTFVNGTTACPFVRNVYGTPLKVGLEFDCLADIGRIESVHFSPDYWASSGLTNAPVSGEHEAWLYSNGTGMIVRRIDWSYSCYVTVEGYNIGLALRPGLYDGSTPNGQSYGFKLVGCKTGVYIEDSSYAGYQFTRFDIDGAETGIYLRPAANETTMFHSCEIDASVAAIDCEGINARMLLMSCDFQRGAVKMERGYLSVINSDFASDGTHIELGPETRGATIQGNRFVGGARIVDNTSYPVKIDHSPLSAEPLPAYDYKKPTTAYRPAKTNLYVVTAAPYNAVADGTTDNTGAFQAALAVADANGGGTVYVPGGTYCLDGTLTVPTGVELRGIFDIPNSTKTRGSLLNVYAGRNNANGTPFIQLEAGSGIKGFTFHYPEQIYDADETNNYGMVPYPYLLRGLGADVYIMNLSATIPYQLLDLATHRCDRHYVDYIYSTALLTGIHVGNGAVDGQIHNCQFNPSTYTHAGSYYNSIPHGTADDIHKILWRDATPYLFGHMTNEVLHENFVFAGARGFHLIDEAGQGASGHSLGFGVDQCTIAMLIDDVGSGGLAPINSQIVTVNGTEGRYLQTGAGLTDTFRMFSLAGWGTHQYSAVVQGGDVELQLFHVVPDGKSGVFKVENGASLESYGGNLDDVLANGVPFLTIDPTATARFVGHIINATEAQMPPNSGNTTAIGNLRYGSPVSSIPVIAMTVWNPGSTGLWTTDNNWTGGAVPLSHAQNLKVVFNVNGALPCELDSSAIIAQLVMGDTGTTNGNILTLTSGANLTCGLDSVGGVDWTGIGYNKPATMTVAAGAEVTCASHLWIGNFTPAVGTLNIDGGTVNVFGQLGLGWDGGTGYVHLKSGVLNLQTLNGAQSISGASFIDLEAGTLVINGDHVSSVNGYVAAGSITAHDGAGTVAVDYGVSNPGKTTVAAVLPDYGYDAWALGWGVDIGGSTNDYDSDLWNNFHEYALNGDPTNRLNTGEDPSLWNAGGSLLYIHLQRNDNTNLVYQVETSTNLVSGSWTNAGYTVLGTNAMGGGMFYDEVSNGIPTLDGKKFIQLNIFNP